MAAGTSHPFDAGEPRADEYLYRLAARAQPGAGRTQEAGDWLGMTVHRKFPRRVLMALRFRLIDPKA